jgi:hypothetical protein
MRLRRLVPCLVVLATLSARAQAQPSPDQAANRAPSVDGWRFGFPRAIPTTRSASRDAPVFGVMMAPRGIRTAAGEMGFVAYQGHGITLRPGFLGMLELEGNEQPGFTLWPRQQIHFWRGAYAFQSALAFDALGQRLCNRCALEATLRFRHESEHYTGANSGGQAIDYSDRPIFGDAVVMDVASALWRGNWLLITRVLNNFFLPDRSSYSLGPGLDLHLRYAAWNSLHPFLSGYGEYLFGTEHAGIGYPDAFLVRGLLGLAIPGSLGDVMIFMSGDVGHRKGLAAYTKEASLGCGVRLAFGALPGN